MLATIVFELARDPSIEQDIRENPATSVYLMQLNKGERQALLSVLNRENWRKILSEAALPGWGSGFWGF